MCLTKYKCMKVRARRFSTAQSGCFHEVAANAKRTYLNNSPICSFLLNGPYRASRYDVESLFKKTHVDTTYSIVTSTCFGAICTIFRGS